MTVTADQLPDAERALAQRAMECFLSAEDRHKVVCDKADKWYRAYRSYTDLKSTAAANGRRDVDQTLADARHGYGADLFIPYTFSIVETTLARMLSQNPTLAVKPAPTRGGLEALMAAERSADYHRVLLERQMAETRYSLTAQDIAKEGLITGLGVGKTLYDERVVKGKRMILPVKVPESDRPSWKQETEDVVVYAGPRSEWVSIYDFIIDPIAHDIETARWVIHRMWFDNATIVDRVKRGIWTLPGKVELQDVLEMGSDEKRNDLWRDRMQAGGFETSGPRGDQLHEGWEVWDRANGTVTTILDRVVPVQTGGLPYWHMDLCFQIFRGTKIPGELYGIGEPEAIEDLQEEMNIFRQNRRDNALFVLQRPFLYFRGMVEEAELAWGPGVGIPVDGDPRDLMHFPPIQDVPNSAYQDAEALARDIERTTGIDDTGSGAAGTGGANATATGVLEVQRAAGLRIALKTQRFEIETVAEQTRQFYEINKQKVGVGKDGMDESVAMIGPPREDDPEGAAKGRSVYIMGPETLAGDHDVEPVPSSMGPQNEQIKQQRGMQAYQTFGQDPMVDHEKLLEFTLEEFGFENPRGLIVQPGQTFTPEEMAAAAQAAAQQLGVDPAQLAELMAQAIEQVKAQEEQQAQAAGPGGPPSQEAAPPEQPAA